MPGRPCTVCTNPNRREIESAMVSGSATIADLARSYGLSRQALLRHRDDHLTKSVAAAAEREKVQQAQEDREDNLLAQAKMLHKQALGLMTAAYRERDYRAAIAGVGAATKLLELQGKFLGQIDAGNTTINITQNIEFRSVVVRIVGALDRPEFADAKAAVLLALGSDMPAESD